MAYSFAAISSTSHLVNIGTAKKLLEAVMHLLEGPWIWGWTDDRVIYFTEHQ